MKHGRCCGNYERYVTREAAYYQKIYIVHQVTRVKRNQNDNPKSDIESLTSLLGAQDDS